MISKYLFPNIFFVNEVHAVPWEEVKKRNILKRVLIWIYKSQFIWNLKKSNFVIFNHPYLERYYKDNYNLCIPTSFFYNGGSFENPQDWIPVPINTTDSVIIFSYCGNINFWHGVDRIIPILEEFESRDLLYNFYLVGGQGDAYTREVREKFNKLRNTHIIESREKGTLEAYIRKSDYCFLPVADVRTSPGNPIKLFDYVRLGKRVITQENLPGYSDLLPTALGHLHIDFSSKTKAARYLCNNLCKTDIAKEKKVYEFAAKNQNWHVIIDQWLDHIFDEIKKG
jgi:glycosyltransferase involved in cell wall biosynthesis